MRAEFTKRTKWLAFERACGKCQNCGAKLTTGNVEYHHDKECTFAGTNGLNNCAVLCKNCHRDITGKQAAVIAKSNRQREKHLGITNRRRGFRGWRKFNGATVYASAASK